MSVLITVAGSLIWVSAKSNPQDQNQPHKIGATALIKKPQHRSGRGHPNETITYIYRPQGLIDSLIGTSTTVKSTTYTAAGQVDVRELGDNSGSAVLKTDYDYFLWNTLKGQGRLKRILTQDLSPTVTTLQDLRYYSCVLKSKNQPPGGKN